MSTHGVVLIDILGLGLIMLVFNLVRTHKLYVSYGIIWLLSIIGLMVIISFPPLLSFLPSIVGAIYPASALSLLAFILIFLVLIFITVQLSSLSARQVELIQWLALNELLTQEEQADNNNSNNEPISSESRSESAYMRTGLRKATHERAPHLKQTFAMTARKICIFTETYYPVVGGGEKQARALAEGLVANGFHVIVVTRRSHPSFKKIEQFGDVTVYRLPPVGSDHLKKWGLLLTGLSALIKLRRQYELIFVSGFRVVGVSAVLISKLCGKVCILKADSLGEMSGDFFREGLAKLGLSPSSFLFKTFLALRNRVLRGANAFVAISAEVATELVSHGVKPEIIQMIPNSVDPHQFRPISLYERQALRRKLGLPEQDRLVIFSGRLVSYKGLPLLLQVWRALQCKHRQTKLLLVGSGGLDIHNCETELRAYVRLNGLHDSVHFVGSVQNVQEYLQASDIFVFPTENEAFGIALIEAMACGLPVISTSVGGVKDILEHSKNGLVIEVGNFQQLYEVLDALITDTILAARLGQAARQTAQEQYSADIVTRRYIELFGYLLNPGEVRQLFNLAGDASHK